MKINQNKLFDLTLHDGGTFKVHSLDEAYSFCKKIAVGHYENFPVASILIPKKHRNAIFAIYAFARIADDIADELSRDNQDRLTALDNYLSLISQSKTSIKSYNPIFYALNDVIQSRILPIEPFAKLINAFKMDINFLQATSWDDTVHYCSNSANPIGELVLRVFGDYNTETGYLSDQICTGLQLVNFWQDFSIDLKKDRNYIPISILNNYDIKKENLLSPQKSTNLDVCLDEIYNYTYNYFRIGKNLVELLNSFRLRCEIALTIEGGLKVLDKTKSMGTTIFSSRPKLVKMDILQLLFFSIIRHRII